jgi:alkaline phosphatase
LGSFGFLLAFALSVGTARADAPHSVILMIGDGMGPEHVELARRFAPLVMDTLEYQGSVSTDNSLGEITDSAEAATAMATGEKTYDSAISMVPDGMGGLVDAETVWERAEAYDKTTGILSSVYLVDATPGVWAAHAERRGDYTEIALQQAAGEVEVLLGAGKAMYLPKGAWGTGDRNLIDELKAMDYEYVRRDRDLLANPVDSGKLLGFFGGIAMTYALNRPIKHNLTEPTLAQMTEKALEILSRNSEGFFLVVEGGGIDWLAHKLDPAGVLRDVQAFDAAVAAALAFLQDNPDTLLVVTADHETGGLMLPQDPDDLNMAFLESIRATTDIIWGEIEDGMSLDAALETYAGIGDDWPALTDDEREAIESCGDDVGISDLFSARAGVAWGWTDCESGHHTSTRVPVFATGPWADQLEGDIDNTDIGKLLLDAVSGS